MRIALAARNSSKLQALCKETGASAFACNAEEPAEVARLFDDVGNEMGPPDVIVYNASARARGPFVDLNADDVRRTLLVSAFGAFLVAQRAVPAMLAKGFGAVLFTGASASV